MSGPEDAEDMLREMLHLGDCGNGYRSAVEAVLGLVELLRKENEQLHVTRDRLRRERAEVLDVKTTDGLTSSEWLVRTAKAEAEAKRLRAESAELREHSDAYERVCETLGYAEGADGRSDAHYADSKTVCDALKHMKWAQSILEEATYRCIDCGEVFHPTCPTCPPKPGAGT